MVSVSNLLSDWQEFWVWEDKIRISRAAEEAKLDNRLWIQGVQALMTTSSFEGTTHDGK
jgi:hypothetical protein